LILSFLSFKNAVLDGSKYDNDLNEKERWSWILSLDFVFSTLDLVSDTLDLVSDTLDLVL